MQLPEDWAEKIEADLGGGKVNFISRRARVKNKSATGRAQDWANLEPFGQEE